MYKKKDSSKPKWKTPGEVLQAGLRKEYKIRIRQPRMINFSPCIMTGCHTVALPVLYSGSQRATMVWTATKLAKTWAWCPSVFWTSLTSLSYSSRQQIQNQDLWLTERQVEPWGKQLEKVSGILSFCRGDWVLSEHPKSRSSECSSTVENYIIMLKTMSSIPSITKNPRQKESRRIFQRGQQFRRDKELSKSKHQNYRYSI